MQTNDMTPCRINVPSSPQQVTINSPNFSSPFVKFKRIFFHMRCPFCKKRVFDISAFPKENIEIELKCPQCNQIVLVPCNENNKLT